MTAPRLGLLAPLRWRDFALLTTGLTISMLGDGLFLVALAWQVYQLDNKPTALAVVAIAWTLPMAVLALVGGVVSDRLDRRHVLIGADLLRATAIGIAGLLSVIGQLQLWQLVALVPFIGIGDAFFYPSSTAIVPQLVPEDELGPANALRGFLRPLAVSLIGPALGGLLTGTVGAGTAFLIDALSFLGSALTVVAIAGRAGRPAMAQAAASSLRELGAGLRFVRTHPWCWTSLIGGSLALLCTMGPSQVLLPYLVKNDLHAGAQGLGLILAMQGAGAVILSIVVGQTGVPRRLITAMYVAWASGLAVAAGYGVATSLVEAVGVAVVAGALQAAAEIFWVTMLQRFVPGELLGRVSSVDVLCSSALIPLSQVAVGPLAQAFGVRAVMVVGPLLAGVVFISFLLVPGVRDPERVRSILTTTPLRRVEPREL